MKKTLILLFLTTLFTQFGCSNDDSIISDPTPQYPNGTWPIEASEQRTGDATAGLNYLKYGDYISSGWPLGIHDIIFPEGENLLERTGDNLNLTYNYTAVDAKNGVQIVTGNCFQCHAGYVNNEFILGLGNNFSDFTESQTGLATTLETIINDTYGSGSIEAEAYLPYSRSVQAIGDHLNTDIIGLNPAAKLGLLLAAHLNKDDFTWSDEPMLTVPQEMVPSDVPAWWLLKKKNAMFYAGISRGDFARIMMASSTMTVPDITKVREVDENFNDVLAYINSLEAPIFPQNTDALKIGEGEKIFNDKCAQCHGTYGATETYPNLMVDVDEVGTDPALISSNFAYDDLINWYNTSWFSKNPYSSKMVVENGYVAPPLDGVWATAPYLHNGSIPNLETLLNSNIRPKYWEKDNNLAYDFDKVGLVYTEHTEPGGKMIYNSNLLGYGNEGHLYGDGLTDIERSDLIEYLKSL